MQRGRPGATERRIYRELSGGFTYSQIKQYYGKYEADQIARMAKAMFESSREPFWYDKAMGK